MILCSLKLDYESALLYHTVLIFVYPTALLIEENYQDNALCTLQSTFSSDGEYSLKDTSITLWCNQFAINIPCWDKVWY